MENKIFSDEELKEMGVRTLDLLTQAIENGDKERAKKLAERMYRESLNMHDTYVDWTTGLMDYIYKNCGEDSLYEAEKKILASTTAKLRTRTADFRQRVKAMLIALRGHQQPLKVEEDDEKVCITMEPCGSGMRSVERGIYEPPCSFAMIQKPHPMTWGMIDFPIYCTHSPILEILSIEQIGYPNAIASPPAKVARGKACTYCIYKNPEDIPEEAYTRVGKQKPSNLK